MRNWQALVLCAALGGVAAQAACVEIEPNNVR